MKNLKQVTGWLFVVIMAVAISQLFNIPFLPLLAVLTITSLFFLPETALYVVVSNPLIGKASGSMGGATFSTWKGKNVLKNKATSVANPNTILQQMRRSALEQSTALFRSNSAAINLGYKKKAVGMSAYNAFSREILKNSFNYTAPPVATLTNNLLRTSSGTIADTYIGVLTADRSANTIEAVYQATIEGIGQSLNDRALFLVYNSTKGTWAIGNTTALRSAGLASVVMPALWTVGDAIQAYLGFYNPVSGDSSNNTWNSGVVVA